EIQSPSRQGPISHPAGHLLREPAKQDAVRGTDESVGGNPESPGFHGTVLSPASAGGPCEMAGTTPDRSLPQRESRAPSAQQAEQTARANEQRGGWLGDRQHLDHDVVDVGVAGAALAGADADAIEVGGVVLE